MALLKEILDNFSVLKLILRFSSKYKHKSRIIVSTSGLFLHNVPSIYDRLIASRGYLLGADGVTHGWSTFFWTKTGCRHPTDSQLWTEPKSIPKHSLRHSVTGKYSRKVGVGPLPFPTLTGTSGGAWKGSHQSGWCSSQHVPRRRMALVVGLYSLLTLETAGVDVWLKALSGDRPVGLFTSCFHQTGGPGSRPFLG